MRRSAALVAVTTCSGLLAAGLLIAPAAQAYPPGKQQKTELNKDEIRPGGRFKVEVRNAQPGCRVTFTIVNSRGREVTQRVATVGEDRYAIRQFSGDTPTRAGDYTVVTRVSGQGCASAESSASFTVR